MLETLLLIILSSVFEFDINEARCISFNPLLKKNIRGQNHHRELDKRREVLATGIPGRTLEGFLEDKYLLQLMLMHTFMFLWTVFFTTLNDLLS